MSLKVEHYQYQRVKEEAQYIVELSTKLEAIKNLEEQSLLKPSSNLESFEKRQLRDIKNLITNIYLTLNLQEIEGICDEVFNSDFKRKE